MKYERRKWAGPGALLGPCPREQRAKPAPGSRSPSYLCAGPAGRHCFGRLLFGFIGLGRRRPFVSARFVRPSRGPSVLRLANERALGQCAPLDEWARRDRNLNLVENLRSSLASITHGDARRSALGGAADELRFPQSRPLTT